MKWLTDLIVGFFIGLANIIPGVSGGTFLLIFGIYERVISVLNKMGVNTIIEIVKAKLAIFKAEDKKAEFGNFLKLIDSYDLLFLTRLLTGAAIAIVVLSALMEYLLINQFSPTYGLFFGLILISIIIPIKMIKSLKPLLLLPFIIGIILTLFVSMSVNPYDKAQKKSDMYKARYEMKLGKDLLKEEEAPKKAEPFSYTGRYTLGEYLYAGLTGSVAISAMVLPGVSGSLVMILMGEYFEIVSAISGLKTLELDYIIFLSFFSLGMIFGLLLFARLVNFVFKKFHDGTMTFLIGLMVGSLYTLWPFKKYMVIDEFIKDGQTIRVIKDSIIYTNINILPENSGQLVSALICFLIGGAIMFFFSKKEIKSN